MLSMSTNIKIYVGDYISVKVGNNDYCLDFGARLQPSALRKDMFLFSGLLFLQSCWISIEQKMADAY